MEAGENRDADKTRQAPTSVVNSLFHERFPRERRIRTDASSDAKDREPMGRTGTR